MSFLDENEELKKQMEEEDKSLAPTPSEVQRLVAMSLLTAMALAVQYFESTLPPIIPGLPVRIGFSNVFCLYALFRIGVKPAFFVALARCALFAMVTGSVSGLFYSLAGSLLSVTGMALLIPLLFSGRLTLYGVSVAGAFLFNVGQCIVGLFVVGRYILTYLPFMGLLSIPAGMITAYLTFVILRRLPNL